MTSCYQYILGKLKQYITVLFSMAIALKDQIPVLLICNGGYVSSLEFMWGGYTTLAKFRLTF